jgi:hypothetical protein
MATGRMLNKSISIDPEFNTMSVDARELFLKTIPHLDRDGLIAGHPSKLWATIDPFHADRLQRMGEYIQEWIDAGLVIRYDDGRETIIFFTGFKKNNPHLRHDREARSKYPPPPGWIRTREGLVREEYLNQTLTGVTPAELRQLPEKLPQEDQDQDQVVVVDQTIEKPPQVRVEGGGAGGGTPDDGYTHLLQLPPTALTEAARQLGPMIFGGDWLGDYEEYISTLDIAQSVVLVEWLYHLNTSDYSTYEGINNLPAFVRKCVIKNSRPSLTTKRRQDMIAQVLRIFLESREP